MTFKRNWDSSCPRVYEQWVDNGKKWVIQDLAPEDDERALKILVDHLCTDEVLCALSNLSDDAESLDSIRVFWVECLKQRTSLGCYTEVDGKMTLVALNICVVDTTEERIPNVEIQGEAWSNVFNALVQIEKKCDEFKYLGVDKLLHALGLVVSREYRGARLGSKILSAREPLCKVLGLEATSTVFTGPASQKSAARAGFTTIAESTLKELADSGLKYPRDESRNIKLMVKKFV